MFSAGFSLGRVSRWMTEFKIFPFSSRLTRSNSRLPSSMVIRRWLLGTLESSHAMMVVLPEPVEPAIHTLTPYRMQAIRKWSISAVALPESSSFCSETVCWLTIRIEALMPTSGSTMGVLSTEIRMFLSRKPTTLGMVSSMTMPQALSIRRTTSMACCGEENLSGILMLRPPASITSMSL